ncbi:hypothetical protein CgunFtcFv8_001292 [Champsocephalus gunnari]|uniref:Uncharacterized protein n=1 Tax=Champsocephalus gunnari TaxID=52237 RepID=A0AAN8DP86_CHAGU|nr:hypothetical protein CgunFtcFv8_001292 [Champsocephalus gunnari]
MIASDRSISSQTDSLTTAASCTALHISSHSADAFIQMDHSEYASSISSCFTSTCSIKAHRNLSSTEAAG